MLLPTLVLASAKGAEPLPKNVRQLLTNYCIDCHSVDNAEGGLRLDLKQTDWSTPNSLSTWEHVHLMLSKEVMPPTDAEQPSVQERAILLAWLDRELIRNSPIGGTPLRRLSRREYRNTIANLFGLKDFELPNSFPPDNELHGFDNQGEALVIAASHLEAFAETATSVADQFFSPNRKPVPSQSVSIAPSDLTISYSSACLIDGAMRLGSSGSNLVRHATWPSRFEALANGKYSVELTLSSQGMIAKTPVLSVAAMTHPTSATRACEELQVPSAEPKTFRFDVDLDRGETLAFRYTNGPLDYDDPESYRTLLQDLLSTDPKLAAAWDAVGSPARGGNGWDRVKETMADENLDPTAYAAGTQKVENLIKAMLKNKVSSGETLVYRFFEEGPFIAIHDLKVTGPTEIYRDRDDIRRERLRAELIGDSDEVKKSGFTRSFFRDFLPRAFRRPAQDAEIDAYVQLVSRETKRTGSLDRGLHLAIRTVLISPAFLYRSIGPGQLTDFELANRLAYFLTSHPPDERLRRAAESGQLRKPSVLAAHAKRLIGPRFAKDFPDQWLGLAAIDTLMPDSRLIRKFTPQHRKAMRDEVEQTFLYILRKNLPVREFIAPDFVFTDEIVGWDIYALPELRSTVKKKKASGKGVRKIDVARDSRHGGLLGMPAVMMATANGVDTQPVLRGVWVLENILGSPPPEPPNAVPALTPDTRGTSTPKGRLAAHMASESCAVCHREIDPLGFVLENFDPIGRWRDHYPQYTDQKGTTKTTNGAPVDATGTLPSGEALQSVTDLKKWLAESPQPFARCLSEKLLTYATGRPLNFRERRIVAEIVDQQMIENDLRFEDLLIRLVDSEIFRTK